MTTATTAPCSPLRDLHLQGQWTIDNEVLKEFFPGMTPNLENLTAKQWKECTIRGLVAVLKTMGKMQTVLTDLQQGIEGLGLRKYDEQDVASK